VYKVLYKDDKDDNTIWTCKHTTIRYTCTLYSITYSINIAILKLANIGHKLHAEILYK